MCHAAPVTRDGDGHGIGDRTEVVPYDSRRLTPKKLGRYTLERIIAQGGMAEIWLATADGPSGFQKKVVVKRVRPSLIKLAMKQQSAQGSSANRTVEMFVREARLLARLEHANIVQVFELGVQPPKKEGELGEHFIVMEYLEGLTLKDLALRSWEARRPLPVETVVRAIADVCLGLDHAHRLKDERGQPANLVHRDISPDNLFCTLNGATKLLDFGIAKREDWAGLTQVGELKGKVPYMAPEQLKGARLDARTDLFAIGVVLFWLLSGRRPFDGPSDIFTMKAIIEDPPPSLRTLNPNVPAMLEDVVLSCLQKDPDQRISSAAALHDALSMLLLSVHGQQMTSVSDLVSAAMPLAMPSYEIVPAVAAVPSTLWASASGRPSSAVAHTAPVSTEPSFEPNAGTEQRTAQRGAPAPVANLQVGAPRSSSSVPAPDADTLMQVDPADVPSTIPPEGGTLVRQIPITIDEPTMQRTQPPVVPLTPPRQPPTTLPEAPTRPIQRPPDGAPRPSWKDQVPAELRDTVDLSKEAVDEAPTRQRQRPPTNATATTGSVADFDDAPKRGAAQAVIATLTGTILASVVLAGIAYAFGFFDSGHDVVVVADAGVVAPPPVPAPTPAPPAPVVALVADAGNADVADAGIADAIVDAGVVADAGTDELPSGEDLDDDPPNTPPNKRKKKPKPQPQGEGHLVIRVRPWARVTIDGLGIGTTPLPALPIGAGKHRLRLEHQGVVKFMSVEVTANKTTTVQVDMREP